MAQEFVEVHPKNGWDLFVDYLTQSLARAQKRLGSEKHTKIAALMYSALKTQRKTNDVCEHEGWIKTLLTDYYDPMYEYQLNKKSDKIVFRGSYNEVHDWAQEQSFLQG